MATKAYQIPVYQVRLVRQSMLKVGAQKCTSPIDAFELFRDYFDGLDREHMVVGMLDTKNQVIGINTVSIGTLTSADASPRDIFKPAILANANSIILAHNHPSGDPSPSNEDRAVTITIRAVGAQLGIKLHDHIILGRNGAYFSFVEAEVKANKKERIESKDRMIAKARKQVDKGKGTLRDKIDVLAQRIAGAVGLGGAGAVSALEEIERDLAQVCEGRRRVPSGIRREVEEMIKLTRAGCMVLGKLA